MTTGGERPRPARGDTVEALAPARLGRLGRAAQDLLAPPRRLRRARARDRVLRRTSASASSAAGRSSSCSSPPLVPVLVATIDLFARCRRRHVALAPALRSLASRLVLWLWVGALFALLRVTGLLADGDARPLDPGPRRGDGRGRVVALVVLGLGCARGWLLTRPRLVPRGPGRPTRTGSAATSPAMLVLGLVALVVAATNPYSLLFVLPSLHAWLWLPHVPREPRPRARWPLRRRVRRGSHPRRLVRVAARARARRASGTSSRSSRSAT